MKDDSANELNVVMQHVPFLQCATCYPFVFINGFVTIDFDKILGNGQVPVKIGRSNLNGFIDHKPMGGLLNNCESGRKDFVQYLFYLFKDTLFEFVNLIVDFFPFFKW